MVGFCPTPFMGMPRPARTRSVEQPTARRTGAEASCPAVGFAGDQDQSMAQPGKQERLARPQSAITPCYGQLGSAWFPAPLYGSNEALPVLSGMGPRSIGPPFSTAAGVSRICLPPEFSALSTEQSFSGVTACTWAETD